MLDLWACILLEAHNTVLWMLAWNPHAQANLNAELALRGMAVMIPGLARYFDRAPRPYVDGGYYTKTRENRPLIGALPVEGAYVIGALSGYGLMAACAAGELLAAHVVGAALPGYAAAFAPARYDDPAYRALLERWGDQASAMSCWSTRARRSR